MKAINELDNQAIGMYLMKQNSDFISWKFNPTLEAVGTTDTLKKCDPRFAIVNTWTLIE